jgi:Domain of unknown function (DUF3854)
MLFKESGIDPNVIAERGYRTVKRRVELEEFPEWQRRLGLYVPMFSPDGITQGCQLRPDRPRKGGPKYETPVGASPVVDVHPRMLEEVRHGTGPLLITEGAKTGDAATSRGIPTVVLAGVWMWCEPKVRPYRLKPCFDHIRLEGREVFAAFDSDCMSKASVQEALAALVAALKDRGANVKVIYLPDAADGSKQGIDDYLVAGGTIKEMFLLAREFDPGDLGRVRMSRDDRLRAALEELRAAWWGTDWNQIVGTEEKPHWMRGYTLRDVEEAMLRLAARSGRVTAQGVRFTAGSRTISDEAGKGKPATGKAITHLEAEGRLLIHEPEGGRKARSYTLLAGRAHSYHKGRRGGGGVENATPELQECDPRGNGLRAPDVPRLRWSAPAQHKRIVRRKQRVADRVRTVSVVVGEERARIVRLDPRRGAIVDYLEASGGRALLQEICEVLGVKRSRDLRRRLLPMLEGAGIIECEGDIISLTAAWRERLEEERRRAGEIEAGERQKARHDEERRQHRENGPEAPAEKPPPLMGPEKVEEIVRERAKEDLEARVEDQRRKVGITAETFVFDKLKALGQIRLALLMEVYEDAGGDPWDIPPAVRRIGCRIERLPEYENRQFVFAPGEAEGAA